MGAPRTSPPASSHPRPPPRASSSGHAGVPIVFGENVTPQPPGAPSQPSPPRTPPWTWKARSPAPTEGAASALLKRRRARRRRALHRGRRRRFRQQRGPAAGSGHRRGAGFVTGGRLAVTCAVSIELRARAGWWEPDTRSVSCDARRASKSLSLAVLAFTLVLVELARLRDGAGRSVFASSALSPRLSTSTRSRRARRGARRSPRVSFRRAGRRGGAEEPANVRVLVQSEQPVVVRVRIRRDRRRRPRPGPSGVVAPLAASPGTARTSSPRRASPRAIPWHRPRRSSSSSSAAAGGTRRPSRQSRRSARQGRAQSRRPQTTNPASRPPPPPPPPASPPTSSPLGVSRRFSAFSAVRDGSSARADGGGFDRRRFFRGGVSAPRRGSGDDAYFRYAARNCRSKSFAGSGELLGDDVFTRAAASSPAGRASSPAGRSVPSPRLLLRAFETRR